MDFSEEKSFQSEQISKGFLNKDFLFLGDVWKVKLRKSQLGPTVEQGIHHRETSDRKLKGSLRSMLFQFQNLEMPYLVYIFTLGSPKDGLKNLLIKQS